MDQSVLKAAVIYGANAAGKSNLFKALQYMKLAALMLRPKGTGTGRDPFRLDRQWSTQPSSLDLQFIAGGRTYRYVLSVSDDRFAEERLAIVADQQGNEQVIYERTTDENLVTIVEAPGFAEGSKAKALATVGAAAACSFLATLNNSGLSPEEAGEHVMATAVWFDQHLQLIDPATSLFNVSLTEDQRLAEFASKALRAASTGVERLDVTSKPLTEMDLEKLNPSVLADLRSKLQVQPRVVVRDRGGDELVAERGSSGDRVCVVSTRAVHRASNGGEQPSLPWAEESDGTQRFLELVPALYEGDAVKQTFFVDEIDRSMHPALVRELMQSFLRSPADGRQLIVTTHETALLDLDLVRRDEIWFVEKSREGATDLYSLLDFQPRSSEATDLRKRYLEGRYGGVPFLGYFDDLERPA